jgi:hypothetical protein
MALRDMHRDEAVGFVSDSPHISWVVLREQNIESPEEDAGETNTQKRQSPTRQPGNIPAFPPT